MIFASQKVAAYFYIKIVTQWGGNGIKYSKIIMRKN